MRKKHFLSSLGTLVVVTAALTGIIAYPGSASDAPAKGQDSITVNPPILQNEIPEKIYTVDRLFVKSESETDYADKKAAYSISEISDDVEVLYLYGHHYVQTTE